ncbi:MAG: CotH kinase family protein [Candidatus Cryptobacteroides sp.]
MRKSLSRICILLCLLLSFHCCSKDPVPGPEQPGGEEEAQIEGTGYVFDIEALPEIHLEFPLEEWNALLENYDRNPDNSEHVRCGVKFIKGEDSQSIGDAGIRLKGNTSRRRPESGSGRPHVKDGADWQHCHFLLNVHKYVKDKEHKIRGVKKIILKWFKDDPAYCREIFCYDLFRRAGVWTASRASYCRLFIHVEGDSSEAYYGIYSMIEAVDDDFVEDREEDFGNAGGNLWKCRYGATLGDRDADMGPDLDDGVEHTYELKTNTDKFAAARNQLQNFIDNLRSRSGDDFRQWISSRCDVPLLLRTYAVNVACGMWDDYWNNSNNYYIYFDSTDRNFYRFFFIPYDYDNTLGTSSGCGVQSDAGRHNPLEWGVSERNPLLYKILQIDEYREYYKATLTELCSGSEELFTPEAAASRIRKWHGMISPYIDNDTGEDTAIKDCPAPWGNHGEYRLLEQGTNNFFEAKTTSINKYCRI